MEDSLTTYTVTDEAATERLGQLLARLLPLQCVVGLIGPLGAGKTRLVQAISTSLGVDRASVVSPTFVLIHEYHGTRTIYHIDAYRLRDLDEFRELGVDEYCEGPNLVLVEWADRVAEVLPPDRLDISITAEPGERRTFEFVAHGERLQSVIGELRRQLSPAR